MATNGKAWAHGSTTHPARVLRNQTAGVMGLPWGTHANSPTATTRGGAYGVIGDNDFLVTTTGALGYSVAAGRLTLPGSFAAAQGVYVGYNDAAVTGSFAARHATLTRIDYVAYRVRDTDEDATTFEDDGIVVIAGTAGAGAPSIPASLGSLFILSEVTVPSSAAGTPLTFSDRRVFGAALGAQIVCFAGSRPSGIALRRGLPIYEVDTGLQQLYNGSTWQRITPRFIRNGVESAGTAGTLTGVNLTNVEVSSGGGDTVIEFGVTFLSAPYVMFVNGDGVTAGNVSLAAVGKTTSSVTVRAWAADTGATINSTSLCIDVLAIGLT